MNKTVIIVGLVALVAVLGSVIVLNFVLGGSLLSLGSSSNLVDVDDSNNSPPSNYVPSDTELPASLDISVLPNNVDIGDFVRGELGAEGHDFYVDIDCVHVGSGDVFRISRWVTGSSLTIDRQMFLGGYWEFQATARDNGVTSNVAYLEVNGIAVDASSYVYDISEMDSLIVECFTDRSGYDVTFTLDTTGAFPTSTFVGSAHVNSGGYASVSANLDGVVPGTYLLNAMINGENALGWGSEVYVSVQP